MKNKIIKESQSGITLIALIITIIVLLILSGISVAYLTGDNGILKRGFQAKQVTEEKEVQEEVMEKWYEVERKCVGNDYTTDEKIEMLKKKLDPGATVSNNDNKLTVEYKGITIEIKI